MARAMRGSHCVRFKKVKGKRRCAAFARGKRGGKRRGKRRKALRDVFGFAGLGAYKRKRRSGLRDIGGDVSHCVRYKRIRTKRGKTVRRCATFAEGRGVRAIALAKAAGVRRILSKRALWNRERRARFQRQGGRYGVLRGRKAA